MGECNGVVFLSICFDVNNKKLSVIILRAKDLNGSRADETGTHTHGSRADETGTHTHAHTNQCDHMFRDKVTCFGYSTIQ